MLGGAVLLQGMGSEKNGEVEPFPPVLEHTTWPSAPLMPVLKETEAAWLSLPLKELKSVMPKVVVKQSSSSARGDKEMEVLEEEVGKDREERMRRLTMTMVWIMWKGDIMGKSLGDAGCIRSKIYRRQPHIFDLNCRRPRIYIALDGHSNVQRQQLR